MGLKEAISVGVEVHHRIGIGKRTCFLCSPHSWFQDKIHNALSTIFLSSSPPPPHLAPMINIIKRKTAENSPVGVISFSIGEWPLQSRNHRVHRVVTSAFWRTISHEGKIRLGWWGWGGARPPPFITFTITGKVVVYAPAEWGDTLTLFHLL